MAQPIDFEHLGRYTMGDRALEVEILGLFVMQLPETLGRLMSATTEADWKSATHTIKGSARAVGAWALADRASDAEKAVSSPETWAEHAGLIEAAASEAVSFVKGLAPASA